MSVTLYKLEEIRPNNGQNGAPTWIVLKDIVYDVTSYLDDVSYQDCGLSWRQVSVFYVSFFLQHPGGGELITDVAGRDCTKEFDDFGHSSDAKELLKKYKVGELVEVNINFIAPLLRQCNPMEF